MSRGYVYVLVNESMPNLVKVGMTTRTVEQRASELFQTGVPTPFEIYAKYECPNCVEVEAVVHSALSGCRVSGQREFFICPPEKASMEVMNAHREQVEVWIDDFLPNAEIADSGMAVDPSTALILASHLRMPAEDVVGLLGYMMPEDFRAAARRRALHLSGAEKMEWLRPYYEGEEQ